MCGAWIIHDEGTKRGDGLLRAGEAHRGAYERQAGGEDIPGQRREGMS